MDYFSAEYFWADFRPDHFGAVNFWADPSQMVGRKPWSVGMLRCLTQASWSYTFEHDFVLSGYDELRLQGVPLDCAPQGHGTVSFSDANLRSLAGEAFFCPVATAVVYGFYLNPFAAWWSEE